MLLQNLRARMSARLSGDREAGFTLIELLVVMLILGILAAIAIPAFFNQRDKATDADAKSAARTAQTAMESFATDNNGVVDGSLDGTVEATPALLVEIEPSLGGANLAVDPTGPRAYSVTVTSDTTNTFTIFSNDGIATSDCTDEGEGGCPNGGAWAGPAPEEVP
jgi:type IV pilus assembly protein PilA